MEKLIHSSHNKGEVKNAHPTQKALFDVFALSVIGLVPQDWQEWTSTLVRRPIYAILS